MTVPLYCFKNTSNHSIASESKWLVGSSSNNRVGFLRSNFPKRTLVFSPPESMLIGLSISLSLNPNPFRTPLASDLYPYPFKSENNSSLCEYSSMIFSIIGEFVFVLSSDILTSNSLK